MSSEKPSFHDIATQRKELRNEYRAHTGQSWTEVKKEKGGEEETRKEEQKGITTDDLVTKIKSGAITDLFNVDSPLVSDDAKIRQIRARLTELDGQAAAFSYKENASEVRATRDTEHPPRGLSIELEALRKLVDRITKKEFDIVRSSHGSVSKSQREELTQIDQVAQAVRIRRSELRTDEQTEHPYRMHELNTIKKDLDQYRFAATESVQENMDWVREQWEQGNAVFLEGATGTGKTELLKYMTRNLYGEEPEVLRCTERTGPADIFGKILLKSTESLSPQEAEQKNKEIESHLDRWQKEYTEQWEGAHPKPTQKEETQFSESLEKDLQLANNRFVSLVTSGAGATQTYFQDGAYTRAIRRGVPLIMDEFNNMPTTMRFALKELYNRKVGDSVTIQEDSGESITIKDGFVFAATSNLKSDKHKERFDLDDAESRVFKMKNIPYMPPEDQYDLSLALLLDRNGHAPLTQIEAATVLPALTRVAADIQRGYVDVVGAHYGKNARGEQSQLESGVLDPGQLFDMVRGYRAVAHKKSLEAHLNHTILEFVNKSAYDKDRALLVKMFIKNGFLRGAQPTDFVRGVDATSLSFSGNSDLFAEPDSDAQSTKLHKDMTLSDLAYLDPIGVRKKHQNAVGEGFLGTNGTEQGSFEHVEATTIEKAQEIMGTELFLGPQEFKKTFNFTPDILPIPFSQKELTRAKELGQQLILYADKTDTGEPFTVAQMDSILGGETSDGKEFLYNERHTTKDDVLAGQVPRAGWRLTTPEIIDTSKNKNYLEQTQELITYLTDTVFKDQDLPQNYQDAIKEFNTLNTKKFQQKVKSTTTKIWKKATQELAELKINQLTRERSSEVLQRIAMQEKNNSIKNLGNTVSWSNNLDSRGGLVDVGDFDAYGALVRNWGPGFRHGRLGVCFSRSE